MGVEINSSNKKEVFEQYGYNPLNIGKHADGHETSIESEKILHIKICDGTVKDPTLFYIITEKSEIGFSNFFLEKCSDISYKTIVKKIHILHDKDEVEIYEETINFFRHNKTDYSKDELIS